MPTADEILGISKKTSADEILGLSRKPDSSATIKSADSILGLTSIRESRQSQQTLDKPEQAQQPVSDGKVTKGLFGTSIGEKNELLRMARIPSEKSREGLKMITDLIPDAESPSVGKNVLLNIPKTTAEIGAEFASSMLDPETALLAGAGKAVSGVLKTPIAQKGIGKVVELIPTPVKRAFTHRFGQPEAYKELAENRISNIGEGGEKAKEIGEQLSKGLSKSERLRLGQIFEGGVSVSEKEAPLRAIATKARDEITRRASEAVDEGLLDEETFIKNVKTYMPRLYKKYEQAANEAGGKIKELFGIKQQKIIGKRFLKRGEIPESVRSAMGEIKEPAYPVAKGIAQITHDVETAKLFRRVSENPEWSSMEPIEGFIKMAGTEKKLGQLAGKYVHPEIARDLNEITRVPSYAEKVYKDLLSKWKFGKVVLNPATHSRNMISNSILLDASGEDFLQQPALLAKSLSEIRSGGKYFKEAVDEGLLGNEFFGSEIKKLLGEFEKPAETVFGKLFQVARKAGDKAGEVYQAEEKWFKLAKFIAERERGSTTKKAAQEAEKWLFNYSKIPPAIDLIRQSIFGAPFITFTAKALPRIAETAMKNPLRLYKYKILFDSIENIAKEKLDIPEDQANVIKRNSRGQVVILPFKDHAGKIQTLDLSYILPWGDVGERGGMYGLPPSVSPGGPLKSVAEVGFEKSIYTDKPIYNDTDTTGEKVVKSVDHIYKSLAPSFAPPIPGISQGGYSAHKLKKGLEGRPDYFGRVRSVSTVLADVFLGLKASPVDSDIMEKFEKIGFKKDKEEIISKAKSRLRDKGLTDEERLEIREKTAEKLKNLILRKSKVMGK